MTHHEETGNSVLQYSQLLNAVVLSFLVLFTSGLFMQEAVAQQSSRRSLLADQIKHIERKLSSRNRDSLRSILALTRIAVALPNISETYLSQNQTLSVVEGFVRDHFPLELNIVTVKEFRRSGIAGGSIVSGKNLPKVSHQLTLGFAYIRKKSEWVINRINIR